MAIFERKNTLKNITKVLWTGTRHSDGRTLPALCLSSSPVEQALYGNLSAHAAYFRSGRRPGLSEQEDDPSHGAGIEGTIEELKTDSRYETQVVGFMAGILVQDKSGHWTTLSQNDGRFRLWGLHPGRYRITPALPKGFLPSTETVTLEPNSCATIRFLATPPPRSKCA